MSGVGDGEFNPVDEIRFVMQSEVWEVTPQLQEAARDYAEACRDINQRLRRCDQLLRKGLRSEAIQIAEAEPNLLDELARLDFPEREDWLQAVSVYDLPSPESLLVDVAQDLNAAYVLEQPLEKLLSRHRLLALGRAPLGERIAVMRRIADVDLGSPVWDDDIRTFEKARLREIEGEAREAGARNDLAALQGLKDELTAPGWREAIPKAVANNVRQLAAALERNSAATELNGLAGELERAFSELNIAEARQLRSRWNVLMQVAQLPASDPLVQQVAPILGWVSDTDEKDHQDREFQSAVKALERALEGEVSLSGLEERVRQTQKFERELPPLLATRAANRLETLRLAQVRLKRLQLGFVGLVLLAGVSLAGFIIHRQVEGGRQQRLAAAVEELLNAGELAAARTMLDAAGDVTAAEPLARVHQRLVEQEGAERERMAGFSAAMRLAADASSPDEARPHLDAARPLARTSEEKLALTQLDQSWDAKRREAIAKAEKNFINQLEAASADVQKLSVVVEQDPASPAAIDLLEDLSTRLAALSAAAKPMRPELGSQAALLVSRRQALAELREQVLRERAAERLVTERAHIPANHEDPATAVTGLAEALRGYASALGENEQATSLLQSAEELSLALPVLEWQRLKASWQDDLPVNDEQLQERLRTCQALLQAHPGSPEEKLIAEYVGWLQAIAERNRPNDGLNAGLERIFSHHLIGDPLCLKTKSGQEYYLATLSEKDNANLAGKESFTIRYFVGFQKVEGDTRTKFLSLGDLLSPTPYRPPQFAIAQEARERVRSLTPTEWEAYLMQLAESIRTAREMNEFLRFDLLKRVLESARAGSPSLSKALQPHLQLVNGAAINPAVRWMDPNDTEAAQAAAEAKSVLLRLPPLEEATQAAAQARQELSNRLAQSSFLVGWLTRSNGQWECRGAWRPTSGRFQLRVIYPGAVEGKGEWRLVGDATSEGLQIRPTAAAFLKPGRMVFATPVGASSSGDAGGSN